MRPRRNFLTSVIAFDVNAPLLDLLALDDRFADMSGSATYRKQMRYGNLVNQTSTVIFALVKLPCGRAEATADVLLVAAHSWDISGALAAS